MHCRRRRHFVLAARAVRLAAAAPDTCLQIPVSSIIYRGRRQTAMGHCTGFCWALLALTVAVAVAAPPGITTVDPTSVDDVVYDQRQNGTENVRISLSDLKVVLAPADGLFQIMSMAGATLLNSDLADKEQQPFAGECNGFKCSNNNRHRQAAKKNRFKLSSLIAPLLNNQSEQKIVETESSNNSNSINNNN